MYNEILKYENVYWKLVVPTASLISAAKDQPSNDVRLFLINFRVPGLLLLIQSSRVVIVHVDSQGFYCLFLFFSFARSIA